MKANLLEQFRQIDDLLGVAETIVIAAHENPDPDAVSSVLSLHNFFKSQGKKSIPYLPDAPSKSLSYLPGFFEIRNEIGQIDPDVLICLDYGDFRRLRIPEGAFSCPVITIDHHVESDQRGEVKIVEPGYSSTAEIIYQWFKYKNIAISKELASCLLTGIISDSGGFRHVSTSHQTLTAVSELLLRGVSLNKIIRRVLASDKSLSVSRAWGEVLSRIKLDPHTQLAYSWLTPDDFLRLGVRFVDFEGIVNIISSGSPSSIGLFLIEYEKGRIKGSLRSEPNGGKNVVQIARALGGGGHPYAAGFQADGSLDEVLKKVLKLV
ncbi:MAG: bifunctional oligoribonuclease/PAP phosphatase NrnA [Candidatus Pacebacteria bacterium]|nr:bifunctional oligoribonuclease/PAP phosphatase NrnA [Candidatus Paceibacterota bacterium]